MAANDREIAGIRCLAVLAKLSDYIDGDLEPEARAQIDAHLSGCDWCLRFGGEMSQLVGGLHRQLGGTIEWDPAVAESLRLRVLPKP